jgi:hypothetical protein
MFGLSPGSRILRVTGRNRMEAPRNGRLRSLKRLSALGGVLVMVMGLATFASVAKAPSAKAEPFYYYDMCHSDVYPYWYGVSGPSQCDPYGTGILYIYDSYNYTDGPDAVIDLPEVHYAPGDSNFLKAEQNCLNRVSCLAWQSFVAAGGSGGLLYGWLYAAWILYF